MSVVQETSAGVAGVGRRRGIWGSVLPVAALVAAFAGLFCAAVLSAGHLLDLPVPCGRSRGCLAVALHPSSRVLGVPIAFFGVAAYLAILFLLARAATARWARRAVMLIAAAGTAVSGGLLLYSHTVIGATCRWCVGSGLAMTVLLVLMGLFWWRGIVPAYRPAVFWGLALVTAAAIGVQSGLMERTAWRPPIPADQLAGLTAEELVDPAKSLGPAAAPVTILVFADLWCPSCRRVYGPLRRYQEAHPAAVRLAYRHLPLWGLRGHESSRAAAALSEMAAAQGQFWSFADALHRQPRPLGRTGYLALMRHWGFDPATVEARLGDPADAALVQLLADEALGERLGVNATPTFVLLVAGQPPVSANARTLARLLNSPLVQAAVLEAERKERGNGKSDG